MTPRYSNKLLCSGCGEKWESGMREALPATVEEPAEYLRITRGKARTPTAQQRMAYINGAPVPMEQDVYNCDMCNGHIRAGDPAVAWTVWAGKPAPEPPMWEADYLDISIDPPDTIP